MDVTVNYHGFDYNDRLETGKKLTVEHFVNVENQGLEELIAQGAENVMLLRSQYEKDEKAIYEGIQTLAEQWEQCAAMTQLCERAEHYFAVHKVEHTGNRWKMSGVDFDLSGEISNMVYRMNTRISAYDWGSRPVSDPKSQEWVVSWQVYLNRPYICIPNVPNTFNPKIAGQNNKRFKDRTSAQKYLEGRKKAYADLFQEISPPIPKEYESHFMVHGILLPGYAVEASEIEQDQGEQEEKQVHFDKDHSSILNRLDHLKREAKTDSGPHQEKQKVAELD